MIKKQVSKNILFEKPSLRRRAAKAEAKPVTGLKSAEPAVTDIPKRKEKKAKRLSEENITDQTLDNNVQQEQEQTGEGK